MRKTILLYGVSIAILVIILKLLEYSFFVHDLKLEAYIGAIAFISVALGIWAGRKLSFQKFPQARIAGQTASQKFERNEVAFKETGLSQREFEVLLEMANGLSNQEIADKLFVSLSTIKTHTANIFIKLDVKRRTQAVQRAKHIGIIS